MTEPGLSERMRQALPAAMKARDRAAVAALRSALAAIANAEAPQAPATVIPLQDGVIPGATAGLGSGEVARIDLTEDDVGAIVRREVEERRVAAATYDEAGHADRANRLRAEADVLAAFVD
jgi:uncharacterized protein YqeY